MWVSAKGGGVAKATGTFEVTSMAEDTYQELEGGGKLTRANGTQRFTGDIQAEGSVEWLMCYSPDGGARFVGMNRIVGSLGERTGSFVFEVVGVFDGKRSVGTWTVLPGTGVGDLSGLRGEGTFQASGSDASYELDYELEPASSTTSSAGIHSREDQG
jgi:uncharacterized protein DUF3224